MFPNNEPKDLTYITIAPPQKEKQEWASTLKEVPVIAYIVCAIKAKEDNSTPGTGELLVVQSGDLMERMMLIDIAIKALHRSAEATGGKKGVYQADMETPLWAINLMNRNNKIGIIRKIWQSIW